jgi:HD-GYP domain-containing protein (c-di-GMP phosphodiesterase class II)
MSRSLLPAIVATAVLGTGTAAFAANAEAPGALKKPDTTTTVAPAPTAAPAPAPQVQTQPTQAPQGKGNTTSAPTTNGTLKKLTQTQPAAAPTAGSGTAASNHVVRGRSTRTATRSAAVPRTGTAARARHSAGNSRTRSQGLGPGATGSQAASRARGTAPASAVIAAERARRAAASHHRTAKLLEAKQVKSDAPLATISRAADRVVEVIPGAVVLALAGLATLVLMLIVRTLTMERRRSKALAESYGITVEALATAIEAKDHTTGGHIERVRRLGLLLAAEIAPREAKDPQMAYGFLLHDIGKLAVPDAILRAPGRLTEDEWALMRRHPEEGVRMLASIPFLDRGLDVVHYHHERWDGGGYPHGLSGEEIPLWARIFSVVDALDAMTAERPYRQARSYEAALAEIRGHSGTQFDPAVVDALERLDPAVVQPLLEPTQQLDADLAEVTPLAPLVAA